MPFRILSPIAVCLVLLILTATTVQAQTPGLIYKPASSDLGRSVLDPNGDGYTSPTSAGFSGTDYGSGSELNMIPLPSVAGEPMGDLTTGSSGGATDIVSVSTNNQSCYLMYKQVSGVNYLIFRFRLGGSSTAAKGYTFLIDTDGIFGGTGNNPGFEKEVVMNTGSSGNITVNTFDGTGAVTSSSTYNIDEYSQRSVALTTIGSNADYFYDFFVPYSALGLSTQPVRIATATIQSAGSGITGTKADYNGIDDKKYGNNPAAIGQALIGAFPATDLTALTEGASFGTPISSAPYVNTGLTTVSTSVSGTSTEADGTTIQVYRNGVALGATVTVASGAWTRSIASGTLVDNDAVTAKATASGKTESSSSNSVSVSPCVVSTPAITPGVSGRSCNSPECTGSTQGVNGTWSGSVTPNGTNVEIRLYTQDGSGNFTAISPATTGVKYYVKADGSWQFGTNLSASVFQTTNLYATAVLVSTGCESANSNVSVKTSGTAGTVTATPTITTTSLSSTSGSTTVTVKNLEATASSLLLYLNGVQIGNTGATTYATNATHNFSVTGLAGGDILTARAQSATANYWLSNISAAVTVLESTSGQTAAPVITGSYTAGSGKTVSGTSGEATGTAITLYKAGITQLGTATVDMYGNWSISSLTLATSDVLTATAKASGKTLSNASSGTTVQSSAPSAPTITAGTYTSATTSVSGTGGSGTVTVYVDGSSIGTATPSSGSWTLSGISAGQLYRNASITATNTVSGIESAASSAVLVTGPSSFLITNTSDASIGTQVAGVAFPIKIVAKDGASGAGSTFTAFTGKVVVSSSATFVSGSGQTAAFTAGVMGSHSIALRTSGSGKTVSVVNSDDPTATGSATIAVIDPNTEYKLVLNAPADIAAGNRAAYTVTRQDFYDNPTTTGARTVHLTASGATGVFYNAASGGTVITSVTIGAGNSSANFWFYATTAGSYTITASDASPADGNTGLQDATDAIALTAATASKFVLTASAYVSTSGILPITAQYADAFGNAVATAGITVSWSSNNAGTFTSSGTSTTNASGIATINFNQSAAVGTVHTLTASASSGAVTGNTTSTVVAGKVWTGQTNNSAGQNGNWQDNNAPNTEGPLYFASNPTNPLILDGNQTFTDIHISGSTASHKLELNGKKLTIKGSINLGGSAKIKANAAGDEIEMAGSSPQTIPSGAFENNEVTHLRINNGSGVSLGGPVILKGNLTPAAGTLTTSGNLVLQSSLSGTARVAEGSAAGGYISGDVTTERFLSQTANISRTGRAWRLMTIPVTGTGASQTLRNFFMDGQAGADLTDATTRNSQPVGYGTVIVGHSHASASAATAAGFDWVGVAGQVSSLREYVANSGGGSFASSQVPVMTTTFSAAAQGYMVYARGDRREQYNGTTNSTTTNFRATGALKQGTQNVSIPAPSTAAYALVGNPFMCLLDMEKVMADAENANIIGNTIYLWDANINGNAFNQGGYRTVVRNPSTGIWTVTGASLTNPQYIESGSAFFVVPVNSGGTLKIKEAHKVLGTPGISPHGSQSKPGGTLHVDLNVADPAGPLQLVDGVVAFFDTAYRETPFDVMDIPSLSNISTGSLHLFNEARRLAMEARPWPKDTTARSLQLRMGQLGDYDYVIRFQPHSLQLEGFEVFLKDNQLKSETGIRTDRETLYPFRRTGLIGMDSSRFEIVYRLTRISRGDGMTPEAALVLKPGIGLYPNPSRSSEVRVAFGSMEAGVYEVSILDMGGRLIRRSSVRHSGSNATYPLTEGRSLPSGLYLVRVKDPRQVTKTMRLTVE